MLRLSKFDFLIFLAKVAELIFAMEILVFKIIIFNRILLFFIQSLFIEYFQSIKNLVDFLEFDRNPVKWEIPSITVDFGHVDVPI